MKKYRRTTAAVMASIAIAAAVIYYYVNDPANGAAPRCVFHELTGWLCPGCGSQRAFHAMLHGDFASAWSFNPMLFFLVPVALLYGAASFDNPPCRRLRDFIERPWVIAAIALAIAVWSIARNI